MSKLRALFDRVDQTIQQSFAINHEIMPMWVGETAKDDPVMVTGRFENDSQKSAMAERVRSLFREKNVVRYAFVSEAWLTKVNMETGVRSDRMEVVIITAESLEEEPGLSGTRLILRPKGAAPALSDNISVEPLGSNSAGRFKGLLG